MYGCKKLKDGEFFGIKIKKSLESYSGKKVMKDYRRFFLQKIIKKEKRWCPSR